MPTAIVSFGQNNGSYVVYLYAAITATMNTKHILVLNGPNLNAIGRREPEIYGQQSFDSYAEKLKEQFPNIEIRLYQSNHEGAIIDKLYEEEGGLRALASYSTPEPIPTLLSLWPMLYDPLNCRS